MKFTKVIFLRYIPLTSKIYSDFYLEEILNAGIEVEYWDLTNIFFKKVNSLEDSSHLTKTIKFKNYIEFENGLRINQNSKEKILYISIMSYNGQVLKLYKLLTKYQCQLGVFGRNMFPFIGIKRTLKEYIKDFSVSKILGYFKTQQAIRLKRQGVVKNYDIIFMGGSEGWRGIGYIEEKEYEQATIVNINSDDYDNYLKIKGLNFSENSKFILFLDEYLPLHPDTDLFKIKNVKPENYYPDLNGYFDRVEKQFGLPVVIAAHPKALRYKTEDFFNGRKVVFNKTAELTKQSEFVMAHDSTSINYPIIFGKKIHFLTSNNIENGIYRVHQNVVTFANFLGCNYQYMNRKDEHVDLVSKLSKDKYNEYKYKFQTSLESESNLTSTILIDFLKN